MQKIIPCLWYNNQAWEAVDFYAGLFRDVKVGHISHYGEAGNEIHGQPPGTVLTVEFELADCEFLALNGGPLFRFTPAVSFFVYCETAEELDKLWNGLLADGEILMPLDKYDWSEKYGWLKDRYGVSWQLALSDQRQRISPFLMFTGEQAGKAEEAMHFYISLFADSAVVGVLPYPEEDSQQRGMVKHARMRLAGHEFMLMDSAFDHGFTFNEAASLIVNCDTQEEVDFYWQKLSANPAAEQCGWLKDRYGLSWQIVPVELNEMLKDRDSRKTESVMRALLQMKKLDINALRQAYEKQ